MNPGVLLFILIILTILIVFVVLDNRHKKAVKKLTWTQRGRLQHKQQKRTRKIK